MDEIEKQRLEDLAKASMDNDGDLSGYAPGSFGCHEALHVASLLGDDISRKLSSHPSVLMNPNWYRMAEEASAKLFDLYQAIGAEHLNDQAAT